MVLKVVDVIYPSCIHFLILKVAGSSFETLRSRRIQNRRDWVFLRLSFSTSRQRGIFMYGPKEIELSLSREAWLFGIVIHHREPLWLFQHLSKAGLFYFIFPESQAEWKIFPSFSIFSLLLTPPHFFLLPSFVQSLSPLKDIYFYLLWHSELLSPLLM